MPEWVLLVLIILVIVLLGVSLYVASKDRTHDANQTDPVPTRLGVVLLGAVVLFCIIGLILVINSPPQVAVDKGTETKQVNNPPQGAVDKGSDTKQGQKGSASGGETTINETTSSGAAADAANLGLSGQIVGILGTVAAAAVGGIAGLLTRQTR